jgi:hypothetical protein
MAAYLGVTRPLIRVSLLPVLANMGVAALVYAALFLAFGVSAVERRFVLSRLFEMTSRIRVLRPSPSGHV